MTCIGLREVGHKIYMALCRVGHFFTVEVPSTLYDCDGCLSLPRLVLFTTYLLFIAAVVTELCTGKSYENLAVLTAALFGNGTIYLGRQFVSKPATCSTPAQVAPTPESPSKKITQEEMDV